MKLGETQLGKAWDTELEFMLPYMFFVEEKNRYKLNRSNNVYSPEASFSGDCATQKEGKALLPINLIVVCVCVWCACIYLVCMCVCVHFVCTSVQL